MFNAPSIQYRAMVSLPIGSVMSAAAAAVVVLLPFMNKVLATSALMFSPSVAPGNEAGPLE